MCFLVFLFLLMSFCPFDFSANWPTHEHCFVYFFKHNPFMSTYFIQCLHWWKFQWFIRSKFIKFCNHRCKSIRSHIRVLFNPIMISVAYIKLPTSTSIVAGNFFLCFVYKDLRSIRSNILCIFYCITISRNTTPNTLDAAQNPDCVMWPSVV